MREKTTHVVEASFVSSEMYDIVNRCSDISHIPFSQWFVNLSYLLWTEGRVKLVNGIYYGSFTLGHIGQQWTVRHVNIITFYERLNDVIDVVLEAWRMWMVIKVWMTKLTRLITNCYFVYVCVCIYIHIHIHTYIHTAIVICMWIYAMLQFIVWI